MDLEKYKKAEEIRAKIADLERNLEILKQYWDTIPSPIYFDEEWLSKIRNFIIETAEKEITELNNEFEAL